MFGLLNLNKPAGMSSRDAVNRVQWLAKKMTGAKVKVGHAGTLDPIATGVLVVCLGPATKLIEHVQRMPKAYRGTFLLGRRSPSDDVELEAEELPDPPIPTAEQIAAALPNFLGDIQQTPPAFSAIKIKGHKAYDLARQGEQVAMTPRTVSMHALQVVRYDYPELVLDIQCGSGTYVRALGRDLAESLGTAAVMSGLMRTAIGAFSVESAISPKGLDEASLSAALLPAALAVADLPRVDLTASEAQELIHGRPLARCDNLPAGELALFDPAGQLFGLGKFKPDGQLWPVRVFAAAI